jgi:hypothetical protein
MKSSHVYVTAGSRYITVKSAITGRITDVSVHEITSVKLVVV